MSCDMKNLILLTFILLPFFAELVVGQPDQIVTDNAGRKIVLKADKTWDFLVVKPPPPVSDKRIVSDQVEEIANLLESIKAKIVKSEFETQTQYLNRIREITANTQNPKTNKPLDKTVFVFRNDGSYNAEKGTFHFSLFSRSIEMRRSLQFGLEYSGNYWVGLIADSMLPTFRMAPDQAQIVKPDLALAVYCVPVALDYGPRVVAVPLRFVAFNVKTNEVYAESFPKSPFNMPQ